MGTKAPLVMKQVNMPPSVLAKIAKGVPKRVALSTGKKPVSTIKV